MMSERDIVGILADPLALHYQLKSRGWDFAKLARKVSTPDQAISPSTVRAVLYGISSRHFDPIVAEVRRVLTSEPVRRARTAANFRGR